MLSRRVEHFVESVICDMTRLALRHDAIKLAQGFPTLRSPRRMRP
ncbi:MAG: hypothetical protein Q8O41_05790 [Candidatus Methanoperedens sp.]|nr:hypothetical protein [Candidatus Methanoperedens sp.]